MLVAGLDSKPNHLSHLSHLARLDLLACNVNLVHATMMRVTHYCVLAMVRQLCAKLTPLDIYRAASLFKTLGLAEHLH